MSPFLSLACFFTFYLTFYLTFGEIERVLAFYLTFGEIEAKSATKVMLMLAYGYKQA
jgi:hypothetical protein